MCWSQKYWKWNALVHSNFKYWKVDQRNFRITWSTFREIETVAKYSTRKLFIVSIENWLSEDPETINIVKVTKEIPETCCCFKWYLPFCVHLANPCFFLPKYGPVDSRNQHVPFGHNKEQKKQVNNFWQKRVSTPSLDCFANYFKGGIQNLFDSFF